MAIVMTPIYTQTASGNSTQITFNNIPQVYTDLKLVISVRSTASGSLTGGFADSSYISYNGSTADSSWTFLYGTTSSVTTARGTSPTIMYLGPLNGNNSTASTFSNIEIYIPNYTSSNFKSATLDSAVENNSSSNYFIQMLALLCRTTSTISSLAITAGEGNWAANSTFSLYGIIRSGA